MDPNACRLDVVEQPDTTGAPLLHKSYIGVAEQLMFGVPAIAATPAARGFCLSLVCAHTLEVTLKAFISKVQGDDANVRRPALRHNLTALWSLASQLGLNLSDPAPDWVTTLSDLHNSPYFLRYAKGVHWIVSPGVEPMMRELTALVKLVGEEVRK